MPKISHCLWFDDQAEEAAEFYVSVFRDGKVGNVSRYTEEGFEIHGRPPGSAMVVEFEILGQKYLALNGGPHFKFNEAFSIVVNCDNQDEIDYYWARLTEGGEESACGWLKDRFGVSWQIAPAAIADMMTDPDLEKRNRMTAAMMQMRKIDLDVLRQAFNASGPR